jgi:hypothetical protein
MAISTNTFTKSSPELEFTISLSFDGEDLVAGSAIDNDSPTNEYDVLLQLVPRTTGSIQCCTPDAGCTSGPC